MKKPFYKILYVQVLFAIVCGVLLGIFLPADAVAMKPLGDGFISGPLTLPSGVTLWIDKAVSRVSPGATLTTSPSS